MRRSGEVSDEVFGFHVQQAAEKSFKAIDRDEVLELVESLLEEAVGQLAQVEET